MTILAIGLLLLNLAQAAVLIHQRIYIQRLVVEIENALYERHTSLHEF